MTQSVTYYHHSGKVHPSYIIFFVLGILITTVLSVIYSLAMYYNPFMYVSIVVAVGYSFVIGLITLALTQRGKVRNVFVWGLSLLIYFVVFTYIHFAAYAAIVFRENVPIIDFSLFLSLLPDPAVLFEIYKDIIIPEGVWSFGAKNITMSGIPLVMIWTVEHLIVLLLPFYAGNQIISHPFFEETGHWGKETVCSFTWKYQPKESLPALKRALEQGDINYLSSIPFSSDNHYCRVSYYSDPTENLDTRYLSVENIKVKSDNKGGTNKVTQPIIKNLPVSASFLSTLESIRYE